MRDFNFFSTLEKSRKASQVKRNVLIFVFVGVALLIAAAYVATDYITVAINKDVAVTKNYLTSGEVGVQNAAIQEKKQKVDVMSRYLAVVEASEYKVNNTYTLKSSFIEEIDRSVPAGVVFTSMAYTSSTFTAQCTSTSKALVAELYRRLYDMGKFDNVYIAGITKVSDSPESYSFGIECAIKGGVAK